MTTTCTTWCTVGLLSLYNKPPLTLMLLSIVRGVVVAGVVVTVVVAVAVVAAVVVFVGFLVLRSVVTANSIQLYIR